MNSHPSAIPSSLPTIFPSNEPTSNPSYIPTMHSTEIHQNYLIAFVFLCLAGLCCICVILRPVIIILQDKLRNNSLNNHSDLVEIQLKNINVNNLDQINNISKNTNFTIMKNSDKTTSPLHSNTLSFTTEESDNEIDIVLDRGILEQNYDY